MVRLREIQRTASFAWSSGLGKPYLVTGTRADAVDEGFSAESKLELWDLDLDNTNHQGGDLQPIASITTDSRFYDIAWGSSDDDHPAGLIAGALENGSLDLWDAQKLFDGASDALFSRTTKHSGAIKAVQFNPLKPHILATAGIKGEVFVYDAKDPDNAFRLGTAAVRNDDLECLSWNQKVSHILATGGSAGFVMVWDLRSKKASWTLNNRKPVSAIAWDPNNSTKLVVATPDDRNPAILLWDLRNSNAAERAFEGNDHGVLSLSWCTQDSDILLSCGKDNKTAVWNPQSAERYGEFPEVTNWTFSTQFYPSNPSICATASLDGKIIVQTLQNTNPSSGAKEGNGHLDGEDFFMSTQPQPLGPSFSLVKAPTWLSRPVGASFGFGGKIVSFKLLSPHAGQKSSSKLVISQFFVDSDVGSITERFEQDLQSKDLDSMIKSRAEEAKIDEDVNLWRVMGLLGSERQRERIIEYLGFQGKEVANGRQTAESSDMTHKPLPDRKDNLTHNRMSNSDFFGEDGENADNDDFLSGVNAMKGLRINKPFRLISDTDSEVDRHITQAIMIGNFAKATDICLQEDRMADAFLIAHCGDKKLISKVQEAYLSRRSGSPSYVRLVGSVIGQDLWDVVGNSSLADCKEIVAVICTFSRPTEYSGLCESLGDRILEDGLRQFASFCYLIGSKLQKLVSIWVCDLEQVEKARLGGSNHDSKFSVHARLLQDFIEKVTLFRLATKFQDDELNLSSGWKLGQLYDKYTEYADMVAAQGQLAIASRYLSLVPTQYPAAEVGRNRVKLATGKAVSQAAFKQGVTSATARPTSKVALTPAHQAGSAPLDGPFSTTSSNQYASVASATSYLGPTSNMYTPVQGLQQPHMTGFTGHGSPSGAGAPPRDKTGLPTGPPKVGPPPQRKVTENWNDVPMVIKPPARRNTPNVAPMTSPFNSQSHSSLPSPGVPPQGPPQAGQASGPPPPPPKAANSRYAPATTKLSQYPDTSAVSSPSPGMARTLSSNPYGPPPTQGQGPSRVITSNQYIQPPTQPPQGLPRTLPPHQYGPPPAETQGHPAPLPSNQYGPLPTQAQGSSSNQYGPSMTQARGSSSQYGPPSSQIQGPPAALYSNQYVQPPVQVQRPASGLSPSPYMQASTQAQGPRKASPSNTYGPSLTQGQGVYGYSGSNASFSSNHPVQVNPSYQPSASPTAVSREAPASVPDADEPAKERHPPGDRSHMSPESQQIYAILERDFKTVAARAPVSFAQHIKDTRKRLNILFDLLNNGEIIQPDTIGELLQLCQAFEAGDYEEAQRMQVNIQTTKTDECENWMVGLKRLISMSRSSYGGR